MQNYISDSHFDMLHHNLHFVSRCKTSNLVSQCAESDRTPFKQLNSCGMITDENGPFALCIKHSTVSAEALLEQCINEACSLSTSVESRRVVCNMIESFAAQCDSHGYSSTWRTVDFCRKIY